MFFIDEGRTLKKGIFLGRLTLFFHGSFLDKNNTSAVFTDTLSTLTNFAPTRKLIPSMHRFPEQGKLFPLFYFVNWLDIFANNDSPSLSGYGRPLWKHYKDQFRSNQLDVLLHFAKLKLLRSSSELPNLSADHKMAASIACLVCQVVLHIYPGRKLATDLEGGHMAVCLHVYNSRESILIGYRLNPFFLAAVKVH